MNELNPYSTPKKSLDLETETQTYADIVLFSFSGRIDRTRYLVFSIGISVVFYISAALLSAVLLPLELFLEDETKRAMSMTIFSLIIIPIILLFFLFMLSLSIRRIHDFNYTGWLCLLILLPIVNILFSLMLFALPGTQGTNRFGYQPPPTSRPMKITAYIFILLVIIITFLSGLPFILSFNHSIPDY